MRRSVASLRSRPGAVRRALGIILCLALAACGDLPRPFQPTDKSTEAWSGPGDLAWGSILVPPVTGLPAERSRALVEEVVAALTVRDVPASTHASGRGSIVLAGHVSAVTRKLRWTLVTPEGETALRFEEPEVDASSIGGAAPDLAAVAARAATRVAAALKPPERTDRDRPPRVPVVLAAVHGAPGDGGIALARAMRRALARNGVVVADAPGAGSLAIRGRVSVSPDGAAGDSATVAIAWDVLLPDGRRLGTVTQSNRVGADRLSGAWGVLPRAIARAGAPGIAELLGRAKAAVVAAAPRREAAQLRVATEPPLGLRIESRSVPPEPAVAAQSRPPIAAPLALLIDSSPTPRAALGEAPPVPMAKPRPEAPPAPAVVVEAPIAVSVTVR